MKKRLLLILAVGIAFTSVASADNSAIGAFTKTDTYGQADCGSNPTLVKNLDDQSSSNVANGSGSSDAGTVD